MGTTLKCVNRKSTNLELEVNEYVFSLDKVTFNNVCSVLLYAVGCRL